MQFMVLTYGSPGMYQKLYTDIPTKFSDEYLQRPLHGNYVIVISADPALSRDTPPLVNMNLEAEGGQHFDILCA